MDGNLLLILVAFSCVFGFLLWLGTRHDREGRDHSKHIHS
jgi:hypothetical protein